MTKAQTLQQAHSAQFEACRALFDAHPVDVVGPIKSGADALGWMDSLLYAIEKLASDEDAHDRLHIVHLADMGRYVAQVMGDYMACEHEDRTRHINEKGGAA